MHATWQMHAAVAARTHCINHITHIQTHTSANEALNKQIRGGLIRDQQINKKVKERIAVNGFPSHSYGTSLAIWDHTVLPAARHK